MAEREAVGWRGVGRGLRPGGDVRSPRADSQTPGAGPGPRRYARVEAMPEVSVRSVGALLALAVAAAHVAAQGGLTSLATPAWIGWGYRLIEIGGVLTALAVLLPWSAWIGWVAGALFGAAPFLGYVVSRAARVRAGHGAPGAAGYWTGTASLVIEAALVVLSLGMLVALRHRPAAAVTDGRAG